MEPLIIFSAAYASFLLAELIHWSGIISMIAFGITVKRYGFQNLSKKSYTTVKYAIKTLSSTSDCIIFLFLGVVLIQGQFSPNSIKGTGSRDFLLLVFFMNQFPPTP